MGNLSRLARDRRGNFAIISALMTVPLVLGAAVVVDLSTIARTKSELQAALDSAALAIAREGKTISDKDARDIAARFMSANLELDSKDFSVVRSGTEFRVEGKASAKMAFAGLLGYDSWQIASAATADIAYASYEVALVLDTTGSMKGGKLTSMKDAVVGLVDTMSMQVNDKDKLKFSLVPFATFVNVGPGFGPSFDAQGRQRPGTGANWLDLKGGADMAQAELDEGASRFQLYENLGMKWPGCVETRAEVAGVDYGVIDHEPNASKSETLFVPAYSIDEPDAGFPNSYIKSNAKPKDNSAAQKKKRWAKYGVATDGAGAPLDNGYLDAAVVDPAEVDALPGGKKKIKIDTSASAATGKPKGPGHGCEMQPITPLTDDYAGVKAKVNALEANGTTNIMEGVAWGMRVLSPKAPFAEGADAKKTGVEKIMIVLTDGSNVFGNANNDLGSSYSSFGYLVDGRVGVDAGSAATTNTLMNERTLAACTSAKADGVHVYTIRL